MSHHFSLDVRDSAALSASPAQVQLQEVKLERKPTTVEDIIKAVEAKSPHLLTAEECVVRYQTNVNVENPRLSKGLSSEEAERRLQRDGPNQLTPPKDIPEIVKYLLQFTDPFMLLLIFAGVLACIAYALDPSIPINLWIGIVLFVVVFISCTFSYVQSGKSSEVMKSFKSMLPRFAHVVRDGRETKVAAQELVVGDIVRFGTGDQVPADIRVLYVSDAKVETSSLTGEAVPISLTSSSEEARMEEAHDVAFNTSQCLEGEVFGVVFATGDRSLIGKIAALASRTKGEPTTLEVEISHFVRRLTIFSFVMGWIFFGIGMIRHQPWISAFINGFIVVMIANVPEGLPMTVVSALTITAKRLAAKNVFIKQLQSVETLGSATVIASDKTGTLTMNKMSVSRLWFDQTPVTVEVALRDMPFQILKKGQKTHSLFALELVAALCNRSRFEDERELTDLEAQMVEMSMAVNQLDPTMTLHTAKRTYPMFLGRIDSSLSVESAKQQFRVRVDDSQRKTVGDPSDLALFNFVKSRQSIELMRFHNKKVFELPFNSRNKFAVVITKPYQTDAGHSRRTLLLKGAPEIVLGKCSTFMRRGHRVPIDQEFTESFQQAYEMFGGFGERVLGFAIQELDEKEFPPEKDTEYSFEKGNFPMTGLTFVGLISLIDPPKETVRAAIDTCRGAGIRFFMVTGDHPLTAAAIAKQVGIITTPTKDQLAKLRECSVDEIREDEVEAVVVKGADLEKFSTGDWDLVLSKKEIVFARTTPQQKLAIVENLQRRGEVVAVTGDGVNDSPALRKADIGVAMGISGSDVARDAAAVVLMDDNIASLVLGCKEGRTIFDNLTKTCAYTISHMFPEVMPVLLNLAFGFPLGLNALLILLIDLGTELGPAISLAYEASESDVMNRPPRNAKVDRLVSLRVILYVAVTGALECLACFLGFFLVFSYYSIGASELFLSDSYFVPNSNPFTTRSGITYNTTQQASILLQAQTCYWIILTMGQMGNIFSCKTRVVSLREHGIFGNTTLMYGVAFSVLLQLFIVWVPWVHDLGISETFPGKFWGLIVLSSMTILLLGEVKKALYRRYKAKSWARWLVY